MATKYISPGIYEIDGKRVVSPDGTRAGAEKKARQGGAGGSNQSGGAGGTGGARANNAATYNPNNARTATGSIVTDKKISNVKEAIDAEKNVADYVFDRTLQGQNPNQVTDFGSQTVTYDANGNPTVTASLAPGQKEILNRDTALSTMGRDIATQQLQGGNFNRAFDPTLTSRNMTGATGEREALANATFAQLTRGFDEDYDMKRNRLREELINSGNGPGTPLYDQQMGKFEKDMGYLRNDLRNQATLTGESLYNTRFGQQEQLRANELSQSQTIRNQQLGEAGTFANFGQGLQVPNFQPYQGTSYALGTTPTAANESIQGINAAFQALRRQGSGGSRPPQESSPFVNSPPPGL